jgi:hypothetical protein
VGPPNVDFRFAIANWLYRQTSIANRQSAIERPTRYRVVVLTSFHSVDSNGLKEGLESASGRALCFSGVAGSLSNIIAVNFAIALRVL